MEEDSTVKVAPVTRLRRRLSVDPEDSPLPTTPSTPNKKRGTRLAAKPQLELIDEVASENVPKRTTRKKAVKEAESELTTTPNPVTPSRRSTRIRSNTSLLSETTQNVESPRAKRALRRNSHLGSDTESTAPITPARQTRRTRKGSTTSIDKQAVPEDNISVLIMTSETTAKDEVNIDKAKKNSPTPRKSPRLKNGSKTDETDNIHVENIISLEDSSENNKNLNKVSTPNTKLNKSTTVLDKTTSDLKSNRTRTKSLTLNSSPQNIEENRKTRNISISGSGDGLPNIKQKINENLSPRKSMNKSLTVINSSLENKENIVVAEPAFSQIKKSDTNKLFENSPLLQKPLLVIEDSDSGSVDKLVIDIHTEGDQCVPVANTDNYSRKNSEHSVEPMDIDESMPVNVTIDDFSDKSNNSKDEIESPHKRTSLLHDKSPNKSKRKSSVSQQDSDVSRIIPVSSEDGTKNDNESINKEQQNESLKSANKSQRQSSLSMVNEITSSKKNTSNSLDKSLSVQNDISKSMNNSKRKSLVSPLDNSEKLEENPNNDSVNQSELNQKDKSINKSGRKLSTSIVDENLEKLYESANISGSENQTESFKKNNNSLNNSGTANIKGKNKSLTESNKSKRKSSISIGNQKSFVEDTNNGKNADKSKRTSSISQSASPTLEKSGNENKSTLVISQLKDVSSNDTNNAMSLNVTNEMSGVGIKNKVVDNKNQSLNNYLTSTPIQQKSLQKIAMQINTSIISPAVENKITKSENNKNSSILKKNVSNAQSSCSSEEETKANSLKLSNRKSPKKNPALTSSSDEDSDTEIIHKKPNQSSKSDAKNTCVKKASIPNASSDSEETEEELSKDKSKIIDDEASEASDDYESGDSRDDEDRRYEDENEIIEKGETLDSEEDISNDSDYDKDSFVVSSDAEDEEMLSGTGDDLSMSDNELSMSAKSKKKYNERKLKQQNNASREMYEARHMNASNSSSKSDKNTSKKSKRQRLESSTLESENEQPKKNNRLRIDSSQDSVKSLDETIGIKKKKTKRLSESVCETTMNEKEITLLNQSTENKDPLSAAIKLEPKTPQKDFNISTVAINENIEEVQIDANVSILKPSEAVDPLHSTMVVNDDEEEDSLSENNEIMENYDSVLNNLSLQSKKIKTSDTSLNLNKKSKKAKNLVIDQLNLTQTKKSKKNKNTEQTKSSLKNESNILIQDEDSSDAIDMKLLFPEDSNDSEVLTNKLKSHNTEETEQIIPLKRTEAKTNLLDNAEINLSMNDSGLNVSKKKNKNRLSSQSGQPGIEEPVILDNGIQLIINTTGTHEESNTSQSHANSSKKKKKNKSLNETAALELADIDSTDGVAQTSVETSLAGDKKKKNKNQSINTSLNASVSLDDKKSRRKSESTSAVNPDNSLVEEISLNTSNKIDKKKKNTSISEPIVEEEKIQSTKKKSKKISISESTEPQSLIPDTQTEPVSDKKKKKKNKQNLEVPQIDIQADESDDAPEEISYKSQKNSEANDIVTEDAPASNETKKHKKNKKKKNKNKSDTSVKLDEIDVSPEQEDTLKKRKRKLSGNQQAEIEDAPDASTNKKKKQKVHLDDEYVAAYNDNAINDEDNSSKKQKKNKKQKNIEDEITQQIPKKRKNRDNDENDSDENMSKIAKQNSFDKIHVPKLPESILNQLSEKPVKTKNRTTSAIATVPFIVEPERRKNKPSNYLEQSVYLNDSPAKERSKQTKHKNPKVLPFVPTAVTSGSGYTSNFNINLLPKDTQFVAQASNVENFKETFLGTQRIKKLGTFERCKTQRSRKLSKF